MGNTEIWDLWYPKAAATGLSFARGRLDPTPILLCHAAPEFLTVEVHDEEGKQVAFAQDLQRTLQSPMCKLTRQANTVIREDIWPEERDLGLPVILPGGEVGILEEWWHTDDRKEWRWRVEFYNSIRS
jgi:hypothetical protein